jgi:molybdopterin-containing oxidoreductase family iron-sulfur binding subunit
MRGVMEKCTFCTQRIESAKIARKVAAGASGDVQVTDADGLKTACQQACPAEAIVFGNTLETGSRVNQWKKNPRDYTVLGFLDTRPRITYLAKLRNPNPKMPDYREVPLSIGEYQQMYHGDPFAAGGHGAGHAPAGADAGAAAKEGGH